MCLGFSVRFPRKLLIFVVHISSVATQPANRAPIFKIMVVCCIISGALALTIFLYLILEWNYFLRMSLCMLLARFFKSKIHPLQETSVKGICLTTDVDTFLCHKNNARYMRELDFARADFYERSGLYTAIKNKGGGIALGISTIRYRRFIKLFTRYSITTKINYWDSQSIFMEHRFISSKDNFVSAIAYCRTRLLNCDAEEVMKEMLVKPSDSDETSKMCKPEMPPEVAKWMESNEISSANLRSVVIC